MYMANKLPDWKPRLRFNFPGRFFYFSHVTGNENYEALHDMWFFYLISLVITTMASDVFCLPYFIGYNHYGF